MLVLSFLIIKELRKRRHKRTPNAICYVIVLYYLLFNHIFACFFLTFLSLQCYIYKLSGTKISNNKIKKSKTKVYLSKAYIFLLLGSTICWCMDQLLCSYVREYQLHAVWHVGTALALGTGIYSMIL